MLGHASPTVLYRTASCRSCTMTITLNAVEEILFFPLWCRVQVSKKYPSLLHDPKAINLVKAIDYDFSLLDAQFSLEFLLTSVARARQFDDAIQVYIADLPHASVVNLGAGLDTTFYLIDNGLSKW